MNWKEGEGVVTAFRSIYDRWPDIHLSFGSRTAMYSGCRAEQGVLADSPRVKLGETDSGINIELRQ